MMTLKLEKEDIKTGALGLEKAHAIYRKYRTIVFTGWTMAGISSLAFSVWMAEASTHIHDRISPVEPGEIATLLFAGTLVLVIIYACVIHWRKKLIFELAQHPRKTLDVLEHAYADKKCSDVVSLARRVQTRGIYTSRY